MRELVILDKDVIKESIYESPSITKGIINEISKKKNYISSLILELTSGIQNLKEIIDPEKIYIAKFPKDVIDKISNGHYDIMKDKTGELLSTIIDKSVPANKNIVHQLRLEVADPALMQKAQNLTTSVSNLAIQSQLAEISEMLSEIKTLSLAIKRGQVLDRIGYIHSGKEQLEQALALTGNDQRKEGLIQGAISNLNNGRSQLDLNLRNELKTFKGIPSKKYALAFKFFVNNKYYSDLETLYIDFQEGIKEYIFATTLLATAYERINCKEVLPTVFKPAQALINDSHKIISQASEIVLSGSQQNNNGWYLKPDKYIDMIENFSNNALLEKVELVSIELPGKRLLMEGKYE